MRLANLILSAIFLCAPVFAQGACSPLAAVQERVFDCDRNVYFSQEAERCEAEFQRALNKESGSLHAFLGGRLGNGFAVRAEQGLAQTAAAASFAETEERLARLITEGEKVEAGVSAYLGSLRWPVTWDPHEPRPSMAAAIAYFDDEACFGNNRWRLLNSVHGVQNMLRNLREARSEGRRLEANALHRGSDLAGTGSLVRQAAAVRAPAAAIRPVAHGNSASTITSEKELKP